ncbi:hypothetical protein FKM82_002829 [Ascaphus truei]
MKAFMAKTLFFLSVNETLFGAKNTAWIGWKSFQLYQRMTCGLLCLWTHPATFFQCIMLLDNFWRALPLLFDQVMGWQCIHTLMVNMDQIQNCII